MLQVCRSLHASDLEQRLFTIYTASLIGNACWTLPTKQESATSTPRRSTGMGLRSGSSVFFGQGFLRKTPS